MLKPTADVGMRGERKEHLSAGLIEATGLTPHQDLEGKTSMLQAGGWAKLPI